MRRQRTRRLWRLRRAVDVRVAVAFAFFAGARTEDSFVLHAGAIKAVEMRWGRPRPAVLRIIDTNESREEVSSKEFTSTAV